MTLITVALLGAGAAVALGATVHAASQPPRPHWLAAAEKQALDRVFGGARPTHTYAISYPRKIAVIFEFEKVVICGLCGGPSSASIPRGKLIRVSFDRKTHRLTGSMQFCESRGTQPPRALCLRR